MTDKSGNKGKKMNEQKSPIDHYSAFFLWSPTNYWETNHLIRWNMNGGVEGGRGGELRRNNKNIRHLLQAEGETGEIDDLLDRVDERNRSKMIQPEPKEVNKIARKKNNKWWRWQIGTRRRRTRRRENKKKIFKSLLSLSLFTILFELATDYFDRPTGAIERISPGWSQVSILFVVGKKKKKEHARKIWPRWTRYTTVNLFSFTGTF